MLTRSSVHVLRLLTVLVREEVTGFEVFTVVVVLLTIDDDVVPADVLLPFGPLVVVVVVIGAVVVVVVVVPDVVLELLLFVKPEPFVELKTVFMLFVGRELLLPPTLFVFDWT